MAFDIQHLRLGDPGFSASIALCNKKRNALDSRAPDGREAVGSAREGSWIDILEPIARKGIPVTKHRFKPA
ncbi:MAG TPA: hypothetical protein VN815_17085 [Steroidobacteraceae bacterium]|nr:hypothetical protein [Steroidobacteraceae bacterium]